VALVLARTAATERIRALSTFNESDVHEVGHHPAGQPLMSPYFFVAVVVAVLIFMLPRHEDNHPGLLSLVK